MDQRHWVTRRTFLKSIGAGTFAVAVLGPLLAACASDDDLAPATTAAATDPPDPPTTTQPPSTSSGRGEPTTAGASTSTTAETASPGTTRPPDTTAPPAATTLQRVSLGFVSAYVLARSGEAVVVDTGVEGSGSEIEAGLAELGLGWGNVGSVILTHLHGDHIGSLGEVMASAGAADGYAGAADIPSIPSPRPLIPVGDGDTVFGLEIIETPGHTAGHISVLDPVGGILVAGDALNGSGGGVAGANPSFTDDMDQAAASIRKLAGFTYSVAVFGHGEPVTTDASRLVSELAATL